MVDFSRVCVYNKRKASPPERSHSMKLSEQIYTLRIARNMSQGDLADALEVSRQSVSKWETGAAVPDLDKLLRMSELFGVTLDTLVRGESAAVQVEPQPAPALPQASGAPPQDISQTQRILGFCLLGFSALTWLLVTLLGDFFAGLLLALPFLAFGIICLKAHHAWLVCCWLILFIVQGISLFLDGSLGIWVRRVSYIIFLALLAITLYAYKRQSRITTKRNIVIFCALLAGIVLSYVTASLLFTSPFFAEQLPFMLMLILFYLFCYAGRILLIIALVYAVAMLRYYKANKGTSPKKGAIP
ncbi:MAG: helix-turn-helix transcriptional regulator [Clostridia bacterium]|nr:helix-turn-helix transcriptional regulator [Clostridia bacterium]